MFVTKERNTFGEFLKYSFFVVLVFWVLCSIYVIYQYFWACSKQVITKWWTFIEGMFSLPSYLPYVNNSVSSKFYQWFLFDKCLDYSIDSDWNISYTDKLCHVTTRDYKTYYVSVNSGDVWSDWVPFSIEDVYFTYNDIIKNNKLSISQLEKYSNLDVLMEWDQVKVTFKNSSQDNTLFFANYILPKHALIEPNYEMYTQTLSREPVYNNCAKIKPQTIDQNSLIFDLSNCMDTHIWYYQLKVLDSFDTFKENLSQTNWSIIDVYQWWWDTNGYKTVKLKTNKLVTLFFNTKSDKMTVRLRRALWWFISYNFFQDEENSELLEKYNWDIFDKYLSTGWNVSDFLKRVSATKELSKDELIESWVREYTWKVNFTEKNKVFTFYSESAKQEFPFKMTFETAYKKIWIQVNNTWDLYYPTSYSEKNKSADYNVSLKNGNLIAWLNTYIIYGISGDKKNQIGTINLYNLYKEWENDGSDTEQLNVLYFDNDVSNYIVSRLKILFKENGIDWNFRFFKFDDVNEMEWKLTAWDYDIVINTIDMWLNKDISALFWSETSTTNPSQYTDARLLSLLKQYNEADNKTKIISEINSIYANDMPIVMLWREYEFIHVKEDIYNKLDFENLNLYEYNWRNIIYNELSLTENIYIDREEVKNLKNFWNFIRNPENY